MLSNVRLGLLALLYFNSFTSVYAERLELTLAENDGSHPEQPFDENALLAVLVPSHEKRSPVSLTERNTDPDSATLNRRYEGPYPNGICPRSLYSDIEDDRVCDARFAGPVTENTYLYAAQSSTCASAITRRLSCQLCFGRHHPDPYPIKTTLVPCRSNEVCTQEGYRWNKWGNYEVESSCVYENSIIKLLVARGSAVREYCSKKVTLNKASGKVQGFHSYLYDTVTGVRKNAKWLYLKINGVYTASAQYAANLDVTHVLFAGQLVEMCFFPASDISSNLELDWSIS